MNSKIIKLNKKIFNQNHVVIFGLSYCSYSKATIKYLKLHNMQYKYYVIDKIYDIFFDLLHKLSIYNPNLNINLTHNTFPIIFNKNKFIGGYDNIIRQ